MPTPYSSALDALRAVEHAQWDLQIRPFVTAAGEAGTIAFIASLVDSEQLGRDVVAPLTRCTILGGAAQALEAAQCKTPECSPTPGYVMDTIFDGLTVIMLPPAQFFVVDARGGPTRGISDSGTDRTVFASHEGFAEGLQQNLTLIRRRMRTPNLMCQSLILGKQSRQKCGVLYIQGIADDGLVQRVMAHLKRIDVDNVPTINALIPYFSHDTAPFPGARPAERPDTVAACLSEGRIAIILDQSPFALIVPTIFADMFQSGDDYGEQPISASIARILRYAAFIASVLLPGLYVAVMLFQQTLLPPGLLSMLSALSYQVPIPLLAEVLLVEILMLLILESTARLPAITASAIGIVGGVVLGEALVSSRIASAPTVIIITLSTLASGVIPRPHLSMIGRMLRISIMLAAAAFGMFGVAIGAFILVLILARAQSFGTPYLAPFAPLLPSDLGDTLLAAGLRHNYLRPRSWPNKNPIRNGEARRHG
nr:spore germination protein [bacterium]